MKGLFNKLVPSFLKSAVVKRIKYKGLDKIYVTSISDNQVYPNFCFKASTDMKVFSNFRMNLVYQEVLEHVTKKQGLEYLNKIQHFDFDLLQYSESFKNNDNWGNPKTYNYPIIGEISPSTLRYIKVLGDLMSYFGPLDALNIAELGVGYGGQCRIINAIFAPKTYLLIDIKPALMLTQTFLDKYIINSRLVYKTMNELDSRMYDLFISNYAFSELPRKFQDVYFEKVISGAKKGYITYNNISPEYFKSYTKEELVSIIPNAQIIEERPYTKEGNCIILWGHNTTNSD